MMELTKEQFTDLYNYYPENDDDYDEWCEKDPIEWKPDFTKWVAKFSEDPDYKYNFFIAPKIFWDNNGFVPDWCTGFEIPGFGRECMEHCYKYKNRSECVKKLISLGFSVIEE